MKMDAIHGVEILIEDLYSELRDPIKDLVDIQKIPNTNYDDILGKTHDLSVLIEHFLRVVWGP